MRLTSEALIWPTYARWVRSYRDLPLLYNRWANVVRWELRPGLFLRTSEFVWQEGHTAHETEAEALAETLTVLHDVYADTIGRVLAIPLLSGRKSERERLPGAGATYTLEALMRDGKAPQAGTAHHPGQGFARAFGVRYSVATASSGTRTRPRGARPATPRVLQPASGLAGLPPAARRARGASHVHHDPFDRVGNWLYPYSPSGGHSQHPTGHHARIRHPSVGRAAVK